MLIECASRYCGRAIAFFMGHSSTFLRREKLNNHWHHILHRSFTKRNVHFSPWKQTCRDARGRRMFSCSWKRECELLSLSRTRDSIVRRALNLLLIWIRAPSVSLSWRDEGVSGPAEWGGSGAHLLFVSWATRLAFHPRPDGLTFWSDVFIMRATQWAMPAEVCVRGE